MINYFYKQRFKPEAKMLVKVTEKISSWRTNWRDH